MLRVGRLAVPRFAAFTSQPVSTRYVPSTPCREVVVEASSDDFFARHRYSNYGEVGLAVKEAVEKFSSTSAQHRQVR